LGTRAFFIARPVVVHVYVMTLDVDDLTPRVASVHALHVPLYTQRGAPIFKYLPVVEPAASV
jgi:hypothetical protein